MGLLGVSHSLLLSQVRLTVRKSQPLLSCLRGFDLPWEDRPLRAGCLLRLPCGAARRLAWGEGWLLNCFSRTRILCFLCRSMGTNLSGLNLILVHTSHLFPNVRSVLSPRVCLFVLVLDRLSAFYVSYQVISACTSMVYLCQSWHFVLASGLALHGDAPRWEDALAPGLRVADDIVPAPAPTRPVSRRPILTNGFSWRPFHILAGDDK